MEKARVQLATSHPFYAALLSQCTVKWSTLLPTAGVGVTKRGGFELLLNKEFFYSISPPQRVGLLIHEMLHLAMKHPLRLKNREPRMANLAADIAINQLIPAPLLPPGACLPSHFKFPEGQTFEFYYDELRKRPSPKQEPLDDHSKMQPGKNECSISKVMLGDLLDSAVRRASEKAEASSPGSTPQPIAKELKEQDLKRARVTWKTRLRWYIGRSLSAELEPTRNKPNRRMGLKAPGWRRKDTAKILIGIDESGSVNNQMLERLLSEVKAILETVKEKTEVCYFDTHIHVTAKLDSMKRPPPRYASGGTSFQCMFDRAAEVKPDLLIMMTDGGAPQPQQTGRHATLWAVVGGRDAADHLQGQKVYIDA